jgi:hypothetical protein
MLQKVIFIGPTDDREKFTKDIQAATTVEGMKIACVSHASTHLSSASFTKVQYSAIIVLEEVEDEED